MTRGAWKRFDPAELEALLQPETQEALRQLRKRAGDPGPAFFVYVLTHWRGTQYLDGWGATAESMEAFATGEAGRTPHAASLRRRDYLHLAGEWPGFLEAPRRFEQSSALVERWYQASYDEEDAADAVMDESEELSEMDLAVVEACRRTLRRLDSAGQLWTNTGLGGSQRLLVGAIASDDDESMTERLLRELNPPDLVAWWPE